MNRSLATLSFFSLCLGVEFLITHPVFAQDRYGYAPVAPAATPSAPGTAAAAWPMRLLSWPGKADVQAQVQAPAQAQVEAARRSAALRAPYAFPARVAEVRSSQAGPDPLADRGRGPASDPRQGWVSLAAPAPMAPAPPAPAPPARQLPASIYAPPQPTSVSAAASHDYTPGASGVAGMAPPRYRTASAAPGDTVRFYSLHRQYGLQPDPVPIPPQFFTASADLSDPSQSDPAPPTPIQHLSSGSGSTAVTRTLRGTTATTAQ